MQTRGRSETGSPAVPFFLAEVHLLPAIFYFWLMDQSCDALGLDTWAALSPISPSALLCGRFTFRLGCQLELNAFFKAHSLTEIFIQSAFPPYFKNKHLQWKDAVDGLFWREESSLAGWLMF